MPLRKFMNASFTRVTSRRFTSMIWSPGPGPRGRPRTDDPTDTMIGCGLPPMGMRICPPTAGDNQLRRSRGCTARVLFGFTLVASFAAGAGFEVRVAADRDL